LSIIQTVLKSRFKIKQLNYEKNYNFLSFGSSAFLPLPNNKPTKLEKSTEQERFPNLNNRAKVKIAQFEQSTGIGRTEKRNLESQKRNYESRLKKRNKEHIGLYEGKQGCLCRIEVHWIPHCHHSEQYHAHAVSTIKQRSLRYRQEHAESRGSTNNIPQQEK